ncbi:BtpA/SgcQ family protein [Pediococcus acidilactici]|uniref:BtpA/SgcQ family protein n=1 Tax=Pediococcus acidilactici TaxID=1254 RepID=UPI00159C9EC5|nr:BtpA/SgcQ family protein [Pediococcus acidilactici]MBM6585539.1 membrane biogenesis protein [Pediococcus acidilactici]NVM33486.1 membrane biogenesis protein [Pediococcus acidilactici]QZQ47095.1 membrane complex biogenesis protein, BtpA family [Pediococcus acidilactici]
MLKKRDFLGLFKNTKPIIAMLHLKGESHNDVFERFKKELDLFINNGIDGVIIEDYFGTYKDMDRALSYVNQQEISVPYGVNCLNVDQMGFSLAEEYHANFVQLDSVVGHVMPRDEDSIAAFIMQKRAEYEGAILGGVRFKYQPVLSNNTEYEDLQIAKERCDAICVTGDATGKETPIQKVKRFREGVGDFPLIVGAGMTPQNMSDQFRYADGAIIGSYFKQDHKAENEVSMDNVREVLKQVYKIREEYQHD